MDADDVWDKDKIMAQVQEFNDPSIDFVHSAGRIFLREIGDSEKVIGSMKSVDFTRGLKRVPGFNPLIMFGLTVRRSSLFKVGLFDTALRGPAEDYDFNRRLLARCSGKFLEEIQVYVRRHSLSTSQNSLARYFDDNRVALAKKMADDRAGFIRQITQLTYFELMKFSAYLKQILSKGF